MADVRIVPTRAVPHDLNIVVNGCVVMKIYGIQPGEPRTDLANNICSLLEDEDRYPQWIRAIAEQTNPILASLPYREDVLELTAEMSVPPDFDPTRLNMWNAEMQRDLVAEIRGEVRNARENGRDVLSEYTDVQLMCDILVCTTGYEGIPEDVMLMAIARVRDSEPL